jgi:hypothetical protein
MSSAVVALDAAGPLFENYPESITLDASDALFVSVIKNTDGDDFYKVVMAEGCNTQALVTTNTSVQPSC